MDAIVSGKAPPFVEPGTYELVLVDYETSRMFGKAEKLAMRFRVISQGPAFGKELSRYYNVERIIGKPGKQGRFKVARHSNFVLEYVTLFEYLGVPKRLDRFPMSAFKGVIIVGEVKTVSRNYNQRRLPTPLQYSVISELLKVKEAWPLTLTNSYSYPYLKKALGLVV